MDVQSENFSSWVNNLRQVFGCCVFSEVTHVDDCTAFFSLASSLSPFARGGRFPQSGKTFEHRIQACRASIFVDNFFALFSCVAESGSVPDCSLRFRARADTSSSSTSHRVCTVPKVVR